MKRYKKSLVSASQEVLSLTVIFALGWLLVGYYTQYTYIDTGYDDWMYHAFKIKSLSDYGITSWDNIWANGLSHWRAYQYIPHLLTNFFGSLLGVSIPRAMIAAVVFVFIGVRILSYIVMRSLKISRVFAL